MSKTTFKQNYQKNFDGAYSNVLPVKGTIGDLAEYIYDYILKRNVETVSDNKTLTEDDSHKVFIGNTVAKTITLSDVATAGKCEFTFINGGADGGVALTVSPNADDAIFGSLPASAGGNADATTADGLVSKSGGVDDKDWVNTKATANKGDWCKLISDGSTGWFIVGGVGIWASEG